MTKARKDIVNLEATPYYHIVSRCVRRTFLCGFDVETGIDYSYRKAWLVSRMKYLSKIFAINIAAYAVMSNHYHMVIHVDVDFAKELSTHDIINRCRHLFPRKVEAFEKVYSQNPYDPDVLSTIEEWRSRLCSISWYMRFMNEPLARLSNQEDNCTGHFWEGRFKSQALLDEGAVLSAMVYVDLNPIRAGICDLPELSDFTSIKERIIALRNYQMDAHKSSPQPLELMQLQHDLNDNDDQTIAFGLTSYLKLVDETGRIYKENKGSISRSISSILTRLGICPNVWADVINTLESNFSHVIGSPTNIVKFTKYQRLPKWTAVSRQLYNLDDIISIQSVSMDSS